MARPWVGGVRVDQRSYFVEYRGVHRLAGEVEMQPAGYGMRRFGLDLGDAANDVGAMGDLPKIPGDPLGLELAIRIGGEDDAVWPGQIHCSRKGQPPCFAGICKRAG